MFLNLLFNILSGALRGLVLMFLVNWFVAPIFGISSIGFSQALGLYFTTKFLLILRPYDVGMEMVKKIEADEGYSLNSDIGNISFSLLVLLLAFLVKCML